MHSIRFHHRHLSSRAGVVALLVVFFIFAINSSVEGASVGQCRAEGNVALAQDTPPRWAGRTEPFDASCLVDLDTIEPADFQVIDVRGTADFARGHIKNAVNIPLLQLRTKRFLKSKPLLIVGNGLPQMEIGRFCGILASQGFVTVKVLRGGLQTWLADGRSLSGSDYRPEDFDTVDVAAFFMDYDHRLVQPIDISVQGLGLESMLEAIEHLPADHSEHFAAAIEQRLASDASPARPVVLIGSEDDHARAKSMLASANRPGVFYLVADAWSIAAYRRQRVAINRTRVSGPTRHECSG